MSQSSLAHSSARRRRPRRRTRCLDGWRPSRRPYVSSTSGPRATPAARWRFHGTRRLHNRSGGGRTAACGSRLSERLRNFARAVRSLRTRGAPPRGPSGSRSTRAWSWSSRFSPSPSRARRSSPSPGATRRRASRPSCAMRIAAPSSWTRAATAPRRRASRRPRGRAGAR